MYPICIMHYSVTADEVYVHVSAEFGKSMYHAKVYMSSSLLRKHMNHSSDFACQQQRLNFT